MPRIRSNTFQLGRNTPTEDRSLGGKTVSCCFRLSAWHRSLEATLGAVLRIKDVSHEKSKTSLFSNFMLAFFITNHSFDSLTLLVILPTSWLSAVQWIYDREIPISTKFGSSESGCGPPRALFIIRFLGRYWFLLMTLKNYYFARYWEGFND